MCLEGNLSKLETIQTTEDENYQVAVFPAVLGPDACEIYYNLKFKAPDDKNDLKR